MSWLSLKSTSPVKRTITLYRGEHRCREAKILAHGVFCREQPLAPGWPGEKQLGLLGLPEDFALYHAAAPLHEHVRIGSSDSPFVSFSTSRQVAENYAVGGKEQHPGIVITTKITVAIDYSQSAYPEWLRGAFLDYKGRLWIRTESYARSADAIAQPDVVQEVHHNGHRDSEYLLFGALMPDEIKVERLPVPSHKGSTSRPFVAVAVGLGTLAAVLALVGRKKKRR